MGTVGADRGMPPVVGNVLLVAVVVVVAVVLVTFSFTFLERTGTPSAEAAFDVEETPAGLRLVPKALGTDVTVRLNGEPLRTVSADRAGQAVLVPTAPGDRLTVVSTDGDRSVLLERRIDDRSEVGDLIAQYTFAAGSGTTLIDRSGNGNDGTLKGDPAWLAGGGGLRFDGTRDYVTVSDLSAPVDVEAFTVAVAYRQRGRGSDDIAQLVEHTWSGNEWFLETVAAGGVDPYEMAYAVEYPRAEIRSGDRYDFGTAHVAVGTYDGRSYELYMDGTRVASGAHARPVDMGDLRIGRDFESAIQYFDGDVYELRIYYRDLDADAVAALSTAMD